MAKKLSPWCKAIKCEMVERDISMADLAEAVAMKQSYVSTIVNGRQYSRKAVKKISDYLGIPESETNTLRG